MIDDFTENLINTNHNDPPKTRLDLIRDKIKYLKDLGVNAVEFMPWTSVIGRRFGWGYNPFLFFSVEDRFTNIVNKTNPEIAEKLNKLSRLQELIEALHAEGIHVIMDGVFNHADVNKEQEGVGFPYYWLYRNPEDSPFIGNFAKEFGFVDFNYDNPCTQEFIFDVCKYWLDKYQIDGIRFDFTLGFFLPNSCKGMPKLIKDLRCYFNVNGRKNISLMIEHLTDNRYDAIDVTNKVGATGCWFDLFMYEAWRLGNAQTVDTKIMRPMDTHKDFAPGTSPVVYIENHDHGTIVNKIGGSQIGTDVRPNNWFKTQPYAIALLTLPGTILIHNGQEFGDEYFAPQPDANAPDRVSSRPVNWDKVNDDIGQRLFGLYKKLIEIRNNHSSLRSPNFYPNNYDESNTRFNSEGYGVDVERKIVIYRRWGNGSHGQLENFVIVLNFSATDQITDIPFPSDGIWKDLLNDNQDYTVTESRLKNQKINSNWGRILYM
jgi:pullulanase